MRKVVAAIDFSMGRFERGFYKPKKVDFKV